PSLASTPISNIKIVGIFLGKDRRAVAALRSGSQNTFILKEGMQIGENKAEIKAILPGGIVLVEKIRNVYDQEEFLETIIPVSSN
ncbi:MAG: hypothetical protein ACPGJV_07420, partial [Bacteriovoracaceae bacterium]